jgi:hypothetical protein
MSSFKIFISYRRKGGYDTAKLLYEKLKLDGYSVFFDIDILENGNFDSELEKRVAKCKDFLIILSPGIFDRLSKEDYDSNEDWVRQEIICAINAKKNIIPLVFSDFIFPKSLPDDIKDITRKNFIEYNPVHFESAYARLKESFLVSKPSWYARYKKRMRNFILMILLIFAAGSSLTIYEIFRQKDLEIERRVAEVKIAAQHREDSIKAVKDEEIARKDSMIMELKMAKALDSIGAAMGTEIERVADSVMRYMSTPISLHWGGPNDIIGQKIFEKISAADVKKTKCIGDGILINASKPVCKTSAGKVTCSYSPMLTLTTCAGKSINSMRKNVTFKSSPQKNEAAAKEELTKKIHNANFNDWVLAIKK